MLQEAREEEAQDHPLQVRVSLLSSGATNAGWWQGCEALLRKEISRASFFPPSTRKVVTKFGNQTAAAAKNATLNNLHSTVVAFKSFISESMHSFQSAATVLSFY